MAEQGLIGSFLQAFTGLQDMDRQRKRDDTLAAQQAVDQELRRMEIGNQTKALNQREQDRDDELAFKKERETRIAGQATERIGQRNQIIQGAKDRLGFAQKKLSSDQVQKIVKDGEDLYSKYILNGMTAEDARAQAEMDKARMAEEMQVPFSPVTTPQGTQGIQGPQGGMFGGASTQGPITLSGGMGGVQSSQPQGFSGVLPKVAQSITSLVARDAMNASTQHKNEAQTELILQTKADRAAEEGMKQDYMRNRNLRQEQDLATGLLRQTAIRLGFNTEKLRAQKLAGEIDMQPIDKAIKNLKLQKDRQSPAWSEDAKNMKQWLEKEYGSANTGAQNALTHITQIEELNRKTDGRILQLNKLVKDGAATPQDMAEIDAQRAVRMDRGKSLGFYQGEFNASKKLRDGYREQLNSLTGLTDTPMGTNGKSLPGLRGLGMQSGSDLPRIGGPVQRKAYDKNGNEVIFTLKNGKWVR